MQVKEIMTPNPFCCTADTSLEEVAKAMVEHDCGEIPIIRTSSDKTLIGVVTDRDIVVRVVAEGRDPGEVKVSELAQGKPVTIGADDSIEDALRTMSEHKVRRLPVIDGHELVGIISQADIARNLDDEKTGDLVEAISAG